MRNQLINAETEISNLIQINSLILNKQSQIRLHNVFCETRDKRKVTFVPFEEINDLLTQAIQNFIQIYTNAKSIDQICFSMAYCWLSLISIHPFEDGNGRTVKYYIHQKLKEKKIDIKSFKDIDKLILENDTNQNLINLVQIFKDNIKILN